MGFGLQGLSRLKCDKCLDHEEKSLKILQTLLAIYQPAICHTLVKMNFDSLLYNMGWGHPQPDIRKPLIYTSESSPKSLRIQPSIKRTEFLFRKTNKQISFRMLERPPRRQVTKNLGYAAVSNYFVSCKKQGSRKTLVDR